MKNITIIIFLTIAFYDLKSQSSPSNFLQQAIDHTESGKYMLAIDDCNHMLEKDTMNADIYYLRGVNKYFLEDYKGAITDFNSTLKLNPNYTDAYLKRAKAKNKCDNFLGAVIDYNNAKNQNFSETIVSLAGDFIRSVFKGKPEKNETMETKQ